jgi:hypothetical protein
VQKPSFYWPPFASPSSNYCPGATCDQSAGGLEGKRTLLHFSESDGTMNSPVRQPPATADARTDYGLATTPAALRRLPSVFVFAFSHLAFFFSMGGSEVNGTVHVESCCSCCVQEMASVWVERSLAQGLVCSVMGVRCRARPPRGRGRALRRWGLGCHAKYASGFLGYFRLAPDFWHFCVPRNPGKQSRINLPLRKVEQLFRFGMLVLAATGVYLGVFSLYTVTPREGCLPTLNPKP